MSDDIFELKQQIEDLQKELANREEDLENYRTELSKANIKLESLMGNISRDIKLLAKVQKKLVPTKFPHIKGFEFSTKFVPSAVSGGDYLDIFEHSDQLKFSLVMTSASGYSLSALLLSSLLGLNDLIDKKPKSTSGEILSQVIDEVEPMADTNEVADMFYAIINRRTLELEYTLLGDVLVFVLRHGTSNLEVLEATGSVFDKTQAREPMTSESVKLQAKDRIIICSRGVVQAENLEEEIFSVERLVRILKSSGMGGVHDLRNEIMFQIQQFSQGAQPPRDQSVIISEVSEGVLSLA